MNQYAADIKGIGAALERVEGGREFLIGPVHVERDGFQPERNGRCFDFGTFHHGGPIGDLGENRHLANAGNDFRSSWSRLPARSVTWVERPVTVPPGRARLVTRPSPTGSRPIANTIGMTGVACFTTGTAVLVVTMTSTLLPASSAAISLRRSLLPSAQRYSIVTVRPSIQPSSRRRWTKAAVHVAPSQSPSGAQKADHRHRLLRARRQRPRRCAAEQSDELPSSHVLQPRADSGHVRT